nr:M35 family metallo-endopeptidase [Comamonas koreensis]
MPIFKVPGPLGVNAPESNGFGRDSFYANGIHQAPSCGSNGGCDPYQPHHMAHKQSPLDTPDWDGVVNICYDVKGRRFGELMMSLRDSAISYAQDRRDELSRWDEISKGRTQKWFNSSDGEIRDYLLRVLDSVIRVLKSLTPENLEYDTQENSVRSGCLPGQGMVLTGVLAAVCPTDILAHRIAINMGFFELPKMGYSYGGTEFGQKDSQLLTLIHEVTHFYDVAGSIDSFNGVFNAAKNFSSAKAKMNADSLAAYILGID